MSLKLIPTVTYAISLFYRMLPDILIQDLRRIPDDLRTGPLFIILRRPCLGNRHIMPDTQSQHLTADDGTVLLLKPVCQFLDPGVMICLDLTGFRSVIAIEKINKNLPIVYK